LRTYNAKMWIESCKNRVSKRALHILFLLFQTLAVGCIV